MIHNIYIAYFIWSFFLTFSPKKKNSTLHIKRPQGKSNDNKQNNKINNNNGGDDEDNSDCDNNQPDDVEAEEKFDLTPNYNHVKLVWFKPTDKRAPFIAIPVSQAPKDFLENEAKYKDEIFVVY